MKRHLKYLQERKDILEEELYNCENNFDPDLQIELEEIKDEINYLKRKMEEDDE